MKPEETIELEDSKTDYKLLRTDLLTPTLRILSENVDNEYPQKTFEIGTVFHLDKNSETGIKETTNLICTSTPGNFTDIKQILDNLMAALGIKYTIKETTVKNLIEGRTGEILVNNKTIGHIGELSPTTLRSWHLKMPASTFEIELDSIIKILKN